MIKNNIHKISNKYNKKICLLSDIHLAQKYDYNILLKVYDNIKENKPDYICIAGDLIDDAKLLNNKVIYNRLTKFLSYLATIAPVLFVDGNHDIMDIYLFHHKSFKNNYKDIKLKNVYYLDNKNKEFDDINFIGLNQTNKYYDKREKNKYLEFNNVEKLINKNKYNVLLFHSPYCVKKNENFKSFNLVLCGHMHNGLVSDKFDNMFGNHGLVPANKKLHAPLARGRYKISNNSNLVISGGIIKLSHVSRISSLNKLFKSHIEYIYI